MAPLGTASSQAACDDGQAGTMTGDVTVAMTGTETSSAAGTGVPVAGRPPGCPLALQATPAPLCVPAPPGLPGPPGSPDGDLAAGWPMADFLELGPWPRAVPRARRRARQVLAEWGLAGLRERAELVVSELMTNAVAAASAAGDDAAVRLWLASDRARLLIVVWDPSRRPPARLDPGEEEESGRGLLLVETVSHRWDWYATPGSGGKTVWALCGPEG